MFAWLCFRNKILTAENLETKGVEGPAVCPLCSDQKETTDYLFTQCSYSTQLWTLLTKLGKRGQIPPLTENSGAPGDQQMKIRKKKKYGTT